MPKEAPVDILAKYQRVYPIDVDKYSPEHMKACYDAITKFNVFVNTALSTMKADKATHSKLAERRETQIRNQASLMAYLQQYEKNGLEYYGSGEDMADLTDRRLVYADQH